MKAFFKKITPIFLFIFFNINLFSDTLILNNMIVLKGKLIFLYEKKIVFQSNNTAFELTLDDISLYIPETLENNPIILTAKNNDEKIIHLKLVKLERKKVYFLYNNRVESIPIKNLKELSFNNTEEASIPSYLSKININSLYNLENFKTLVQILYYNDFNKNKLPLTTLNIEEQNFYESFWKTIEPALNNYCKKKIWELLEEYSDKEKIITTFINKTKTTNLDTLKKEIDNLKIEFYRRAINIILFNQIIFLDIDLKKI